MARNVRVVTGPRPTDEIDRAQELADALTARALRSRNPEQRWRVATAMSPWEGVAQLGEALIANKSQQYAARLADARDQAQKAANQNTIRQLAGEQAPRRLDEQGNPTGAPVQMPADLETGQPMLLSDKAERLAAATAGLDPQQAGQVLGGSLLQRELAGPKIERVDVGDRILILQDGVEVGSIPKGATPDATLRERGDQARFEGVSGSARLGAETARRGQDISAETARRGQDLSNENARLAREQAAGTRNVAQERLDMDRARFAREDREQAANLVAQADKIDKMQTEIDGLLAAPGFDMVYGKSRYVSPGMLPGAAGANAETRRNQLEASAFGIAIQDMKGLGALSNAEGLKVTAAYTRAVDPRQSEEEARIAWGEVKTYLDIAKQRIQARAGAMVPPGAPQAPPQAGAAPSTFGLPPAEARVESYYGP
jgi:hypothetical protein